MKKGIGFAVVALAILINGCGKQPTFVAAGFTTTIMAPAKASDFIPVTTKNVGGKWDPIMFQFDATAPNLQYMAIIIPEIPVVRMDLKPGDHYSYQPKADFPAANPIMVYITYNDKYVDAKSAFYDNVTSILLPGSFYGIYTQNPATNQALVRILDAGYQ